MPTGLQKLPDEALVFQLALTAHSLLAPWEKNLTSDVTGSCSARHTERHITPMLFDNPGGDFSTSVVNLCKVRIRQHTSRS